MKRTLARAFWIVVTASLLLVPSYSQAPLYTNGVNAMTTPTPGSGHDYIKMLDETVNPANGSLSIRVEAPIPKQRGEVNFPYYVFGYDSGSVSIPFTFIGYAYDSFGNALTSLQIYWTDSTNKNNAVCPSSTIAGAFVGGVPTGVCSQQVDLSTTVNVGVQLTVLCDYQTGYVYTDPYGTSHPFNLQWSITDGSGGQPGCSWYGSPATSASYSSSDAHYQAAFYPVPGTASQGCGFQGGTCLPSPLYITDAHGIGGVEGKNGSVEDTNGNTPTVVGQQTMSNGQLASVALPGLANPYSFTYGTTSRNYTPSSTLFSSLSNPNACPAHLPQDNASKAVLKQITLPNGQTYTFYYGTDSTPHGAPTNPFGLVSEIDYPTGAWVSYTWAEQPNAESLALGPNSDYCWYQHGWPYVQKRVVSFDGTHQALEQDFSYTTTWGSGSPGQWTQKTTTVTTKDLIRAGTPSFQTLYTYSPITVNSIGTALFSGEIAIENQIVYKDFNGAVLRTITKNWFSAGGPTPPTPLQLSECTTLPNSGPTSGTFYTYGNLDVVTDKKEYDYGIVSSTACAQGASAPTATPTRETIYAYQSFPNTPLFPGAASIFDRPSSVKIYDHGSSSPIAETDYAYDNYTGGIAAVPSNTVGHDETSFPPSYTNRGNATSKTVKCFQTGCANAVSSFGFDETGQILSMLDPNGNTTTYSYADSWSSGDTYTSSVTPTGTSNGFLTKVTYPPTNGVNHIETFSYDFPSGQLTVANDQNGRTTNYRYDDAIARLTQTTQPDGGQATLAYNDSAYNPSANPPTPNVITTQTISSGVTKSSTAEMDGMGHIIHTVLNSDPEGADTTDTTYDGLGQVLTQSNPHRSSPSSTDGITSFVYDGLGRTTSVTEQDGSVVQTVYEQASSNTGGTCMSVTDEAGRIRKSCADGFGRLIEVDEPGTGGTSGAAGTGTVTISGSEQSSSGSAGSGSISVSNNNENCIFMGGGYSPQNGNLTVTIHGVAASTSWGGTCNGTLETPQPSLTQFASNLASAITNSSAGVNATANGTNITLVAKTVGSNTNYSFSITETWGFNTSQGGTGYDACCNGSLSGGTNGGTDSGTVSVSVNGYVATQNYGSSDTAQTVASGLTTTLNASSSPVAASLSGRTITLTSRQTGSTTNYSLSASSTWNNQLFTNPSFSGSPSGSSLTGGSNGSLGTTPLVTLYNYDALNNLLCTWQKGTDTTSLTFAYNPSTNTSNCLSASATWRPRSFIYDSLSRLTSATNPESGTVSYTYDANGNVLSKVSPKPNSGSTGNVTATYSYDALNRLLQKSYTGISNIPSKYAYDGTALSCSGIGPLSITSPTNLIGRISAMCSLTSATTFSYDPMGRAVIKRINQTGNKSEYVDFSYYLNGSLKTITYPSGDIVTYTPSGAGRTTNVSDPTNNFVAPPTTSTMYAPPGELLGMQNGSGIVTGNAYNSRLQPVTLQASTTASTFMSLSYNFGQGENNGNVLQIVNNLDSTRSTNFQYDTLNRISQASTVTTTGTNCWGETYTIDNWGNLTNRGVPSGMSGSCLTEPLNATVNPQNQLSTMTYDHAGNVINDGLGNTPTYDAEDHIATDAGVTYSYDAEGNRMEKSSGTLYWYGENGEVLAESNLSGAINEEYLFFNGQRLARVDRPSGAVHYYYADQLGSANVITDPSGTAQEQYFYYPYGGLVAQIGSDPNHYKFTGKERDSESGLDNFGFRYYSSAAARWGSADPSGLNFADQWSPQTFNLYSYARNNPVNSIDTNGLLTIVIPGTWWSSDQWNYQNPLVGEAGQYFHEERKVWLDLWDPRGDNDKDRNAAARGLADFINNYHFAPGETLNIVAHSHGGNVALRAATLGLKHRIDNLITLGTPFGYGSMSSGVEQWYNITGSGDDVQPSASKGCWRLKCSSVQKGAHNYTVQASSHSSLWQDAYVRKLWWDFFVNQGQGGGSGGGSNSTSREEVPPPAAKCPPLWPCPR